MGRKRDMVEILSAILRAALLVWIVGSWIEVVMHNRTDCQYSALNMWVLVLKLCNVTGGI